MGWEDEIESVTTRPEYQNARVRFLIQTPGTYDARTNTRTPGVTTVLAEVPARLVFPSTGSPFEPVSSGNPTAVRVGRLQFNVADYSAPVARGTLVRIVDGGRDKSMEEYIFRVVDSINSSHMASRTVRIATDLEAKWSA